MARNMGWHYPCHEMNGMDEKACGIVLSPAVYDEASGDTVRTVDFSAVSESGKYYLIADGIDDPIPGLVSGGPNKLHPDYAAKMTIPPDTAPAKFYLDFTASASSNENTIYWNSPAVFVAAYFDSL